MIDAHRTSATRKSNYWLADWMHLWCTRRVPGRQNLAWIQFNMNSQQNYSSADYVEISSVQSSLQGRVYPIDPVWDQTIVNEILFFLSNKLLPWNIYVRDQLSNKLLVRCRMIWGSRHNHTGYTIFPHTKTKQKTTLNTGIRDFINWHHAQCFRAMGIIRFSVFAREFGYWVST